MKGLIAFLAFTVQLLYWIIGDGPGSYTLKDVILITIPFFIIVLMIILNEKHPGITLFIAERILKSEFKDIKPILRVINRGMIIISSILPLMCAYDIVHGLSEGDIVIDLLFHGVIIVTAIVGFSMPVYYMIKDLVYKVINKKFIYKR
ncbi:MAG: hypothetical protein ACRC1T_08540 [Clostridium chrysemydis]|uniref:hypothetical protein n=1 Tax=Clostridium TaxID=1485 RepID=UPI0021526C23|nr:hypothetical protein [Clostridium sp. LY3-2]MCR6514380.1 hypothetical protein [Clostridium sp. LY3-2]